MTKKTKKFGDRFKASPLNPKGMKKLREAGKEKRKENREGVKKMLKKEHEERKKDLAGLKEFAKTGKRSSDYALRRKKGKEPENYQDQVKRKFGGGKV